MSGQPTVRVGQVWADNDKRSRGRHLKVIDISRRMGTDRAEVQQCDQRGRIIGSRTTFIRLDRFRPTSTGYRLVRDVEDGAS